MSWKRTSRGLPRTEKIFRARSHKACSTISHLPPRVDVLPPRPPSLLPPRPPASSLSLSARPEFDPLYCSPCWILLGGSFSWKRTPRGLPHAEEIFRARSRKACSTRSYSPPRVVVLPPHPPSIRPPLPPASSRSFPRFFLFPSSPSCSPSSFEASAAPASSLSPPDDVRHPGSPGMRPPRSPRAEAQGGAEGAALDELFEDGPSGLPEATTTTTDDDDDDGGDDDNDDATEAQGGVIVEIIDVDAAGAEAQGGVIVEAEPPEATTTTTTTPAPTPATTVAATTTTTMTTAACRPNARG